MEANAKRTLVKSAPELWELLDDENRMAAWSARLHDGGPVAVDVYRREPAVALAWRANGPGSTVEIEVELAEKGFGTAVRLSVRGAGPAEPDATMRELLDELGSPERQPFAV